MSSIHAGAIGIAVVVLIVGMWRFMRCGYYRQLADCLDKLAAAIAAGEDITATAEWIKTDLANIEKSELVNIARSKWLWPTRETERIEALWAVLGHSVTSGRHELGVLTVQRVIQVFAGAATGEAISSAITFALGGLVIGLLGLWI